ncbi:MAG: peptide ABC transporter substrate-binding protein [Chloroflexi bacterium]|nr:peptide ABC transporter substrate-binding protein [Chloroflexota bacterium]
MSVLYGRRTFLRQALIACGATGLLAACGPAAPAPSATSAPAAAATAAPAGATSAPKRGGTLKVALNSDIIGIDPHGASAGVDRNVYTSVYNGLVAPDKNLNIVPDLAESWTTPDPTTYVFKLRPNVKFHDGTACDATAVKQNFDWILDPANASPRKPEIDDVDQVSLVDPLTVKITLKSAFAPFLSIISDRAGYIVSPTARAKFGKDFTRNPVGTGPFQFAEWVKDDHATFKRFDGYFESGIPNFDQITYRPIPDLSVGLTELKTGNVDFLYSVDPKDVPDIKSTPNLVYLEGPGVGYQGLWINTAKGPLSNKSLRQAVNLAVDREALLAAVYFGIGQIAAGPIPPGLTNFFDSSVAYVKRDVAAAKQKLTEGGQPNGFSMVLKSQSGSPIQDKITQLVQAQLGEIGIQVQIQTVEFGALLNAGDQGDFDALSLGWSGRIDPDGNIEPIFQTKGAFNYGKYSSQAVDDAIVKERQAADTASRKQIFLELQQTINDDDAYVFTYFPPTIFAATNTVQGFQITPDGLMRFKSTWKA